MIDCVLRVLVSEGGRRQRCLALGKLYLKLEICLGLYYVFVSVWDLRLLLVCLMGLWFVDILLRILLSGLQLEFLL